jgi:hypothetical protein
MKLVNLNLSAEQIRKVRKSLPIKINKSHKAMSGEGVNLLVDETNYNNLTKKFDTNKGLLFKLSQSEVAANKDIDRVADEDVKEVMTGAGLFKHKKAKKTIKKIVDALEGDMEGKGLFKSAKKAVSKGSKSVVKQTKSVAKDLTSSAKKEAEEGLKKTISKVKNQAKKAIPEEMKETIDLVSKSVKGLKTFDAKKIDKIISDIPKAYRDEIKDTYVGQMIRESLVVGTDIAVQSAISAMAMNPYTAPLAPMVQIAWQTEQASGQPMTRMAIEKIGLGLGLGLRASGEGLRLSGKGVKVGSGLSASGRGLSASGRGLSVGGGVEMIKHKINTTYLEDKLTNKATEKSKVVKQKAHNDKLIMGLGGGTHITGLFLDKPVMSGILKARPLKRVSMLEGKHR